MSTGFKWLMDLVFEQYFALIGQTFSREGRLGCSLRDDHPVGMIFNCTSIMPSNNNKDECKVMQLGLLKGLGVTVSGRRWLKRGSEESKQNTWVIKRILLTDTNK